MKKLRFLLVGCGAIGERHAKLAAEKGELVAVCDVDERKVKAFSKNYSCFGYTSLNDMLRQVIADALIVCTPNGLHAEHSIAGLSNQLHVLCEKPMAIASADGKRMIKAAVKANRHLLIVKQNRFNPPVVAVKQLLQTNKLGKVYSIQLNCSWNRGAKYYQQSNWRGTKILDGGVLFTQFSHFIDLLYWFFGGIQQTKGFTANVAHTDLIEIDDTGVFSFITEAGVPGSLHYSTNSKNKNYEGSITILAEKATIKIGGPYLNTLEYQEPVMIDVKKLTTGNGSNKYKGYEGSMNNHAKVYDAFLKVIAGKQQHYVTGEEGLQSVKMIEQFYKASR
ncbi:Gfo/Idh/MocA family oxidoreductase [Lacibacter luteus]|uniref:Gfo/Idh/MocA family oxidoreductase n=1 Tax=Lacibacter luteus TaxID=2508719 RepID=A0A4Q1CD73_9BACT|nr:Gfo/Idh/MocA family oxidoreductase [Lacibacter luteus]RXK57442.1 Gfo/Idh/MocA family oxidoreductase [Lacibacter luteus]